MFLLVLLPALGLCIDRCVAYDGKHECMNERRVVPLFCMHETCSNEESADRACASDVGCLLLPWCVHTADRNEGTAMPRRPTLHSWELDKIGKHSLCIRANLMASSHTFSKTPRSSHMYMLNISPALRNLRNHPELACACCSTQAVRATAALKVLPDIAYLI